MEWINLHTSTLDSVEFKSAEDREVGVWLRLLRYCCGQENGGCIAGARKWSERQWLALVGVDRSQLLEPNHHDAPDCKLWSWEGDDLTVEFYPRKRESEIRAKRRGGKVGAHSRWKAAKDPSNPAPSIASPPPDNGSPNGSPIHQPEDESMTELMRKNKSKGKEKSKEKENPPHPPLAKAPEGGGGEEVSGRWAEAPSVDEVFAHAAQWPGDMARMVPTIQEDWVPEFLKKMDGRREWPGNWRRAMESEWRAAWRCWRMPGAPGKTQAVSPSVVAVGQQQRLGGLKRELREVKEFLDAMDGVVPDEETVRRQQRERELLGEIAALEAEVACV